jgi:hypothetical protein
MGGIFVTDDQKQPRRNLVISAIGDASVHRTWLDDPRQQSFDVMLIYFGDRPDDARGDARYYLRRKGYKFEHLDYVVRNFRGELEQYDYIWCPDDDIAAEGTSAVNELFAICARYQFDLAQPAIAAGDSSYVSLRRKPGSLLRYSPFVEVMCPLFSREAFFRASALFLENRSGWGIDWLWSRLFPAGRVAIIDRVGIHHTRKLFSGPHYQRLTSDGIDAWVEFDDTVKRHGGIDLRVQVAFEQGKLPLRSIPDPDAPPTGLRGWLRRCWPTGSRPRW